MRVHTRWPAWTLASATLTTALLAFGAPTRAEAAVPATIPLTFTNNSGRGEQVYIYDLGTQLSTGRQGWADANGTFHAWPAGGNPPTPAPDAARPPQGGPPARGAPPSA